MAGGSNKAREISLGGNFGDVAVTVNGVRIEVSSSGAVQVRPAAPDPTGAGAANDSSVAAAAKALDVGDHLQDGTVVIAVDLKKDTALFAPETIFGGNAVFDNQDKVVEKVNAGNGTHGHKDWRRITDEEGKKLSEVWDEVAPAALKGRAAPWFWLASPDSNGYGFARARRGGVADWDVIYRDDSLPVPVVRSGPARS